MACVRREAAQTECRKLEIADVVTQDLKEAVQGAELVILCTPLSQMAGLAATDAALSQTRRGCDRCRQRQRHGGPGTGTAGARRPGRNLSAAIPWPARKRPGVAAARADLFENAICLVTPAALFAGGRGGEAWKIFGRRWAAVPLRMTPEAHDDLVSRSSHLPHVVAAELANYVLSPAHPKEQALVCANGFRDTTRIAAGSPEMWRDIALANRKNLSRVLGVFIEDLQEFQLALEREDVQGHRGIFCQGQTAARQWRAHSASSPE